MNLKWARHIVPQDTWNVSTNFWLGNQTDVVVSVQLSNIPRKCHSHIVSSRGVSCHATERHSQSTVRQICITVLFCNEEVCTDYKS